MTADGVGLDEVVLNLPPVVDKERLLADVRHTRFLFCLTKAEVVLEVVRTMSAILVLKVDLKAG